jgi:hypothetical protein
MWIVYFDGLKILKDIIGKKKRVFEPACGYGRMKKYLYSDCIYSGIDLNRRFIKYGKRRNRDIQLGHVLDMSMYSRADAILLCDILHHLGINDIRKLLAIAVQFALEKIIIIEPTFVHVASKNNIFSRAIGGAMAAMDADGFNNITRWMSKQEYTRLFHSLKEENNIKEMKIRHNRNHAFVEMLL